MNDRLRLSNLSILESASVTTPSRTASRQTTSELPSAVIGAIAAIEADGTPVVSWQWAEGEHVRPALSQVALAAEHIGRRCTLLFAGGDSGQPVVLGLLQEPQPNPSGYRIIHAEGALILQCGAARIELREDGRITVQGMQIDNQSYGPYRIRGASIKLN